MNAEEMFKKLGYKKEELDDHIYYELGDIGEKTITFTNYKYGTHTIDVSEWHYDAGFITVEELQAINQQCKELGWLDE